MHSARRPCHDRAMTCDGDRNSAIAMSGRPSLGLLFHAVCKAVVCPLGIPLVPRNPTYPD